MRPRDAQPAIDPAGHRRLVSSLADLMAEMQRVERHGSSNEKPLRGFQLELFQPTDRFPKPIPARGGVRSLDSIMRNSELKPHDPYGIAHWQASQLDSSVDEAVRQAANEDDEGGATVGDSISMLETSGDLKNIGMEQDDRRRQQLRDQVRTSQFFSRVLEVDTGLAGKSLYGVLKQASGARASSTPRRRGARRRPQQNKRLPQLNRPVAAAVEQARRKAHRQAVLSATVPYGSPPRSAEPVVAPLSPSRGQRNEALAHAFDGLAGVLQLPQPSARDRSVLGPQEDKESVLAHIQDRRPSSRLRRTLESRESTASGGSVVSWSDDGFALSPSSRSAPTLDSLVPPVSGGFGAQEEWDDDDDDDGEEEGEGEGEGEGEDQAQFMFGLDDEDRISTPRGPSEQGDLDPGPLYDSLRGQLDPPTLTQSLRCETPYYKRKLAEQRRIKKFQDQCRWHPSDRRRPAATALKQEERGPRTPAELGALALQRAGNRPPQGAAEAVAAGEASNQRMTSHLRRTLKDLTSRTAHEDAQFAATYAKAQKLLPDSFVLNAPSLLELRQQRRVEAALWLVEQSRLRNMRAGWLGWRHYSHGCRAKEHAAAATCLQRYARGKIGRRKAVQRAKHVATAKARAARQMRATIESRMRAATAIASGFRGLLGRRRAKDKRACLAAATTIQRHVRRINTVMGAISKRIEQERRRLAATKIQACYRGVIGRRRFARIKRETTMLEREAFFLNRGAVFVHNFQLNGAAVHIQDWFRNLRWRVHARHTVAAGKIQRAWRRKAAWLEMRRVEQRLAELRAVLELQRVFRGHKAREESRAAKRIRDELERLRVEELELQHQQRLNVKLATFLHIKPPPLVLPESEVAAAYLVTPADLAEPVGVPQIPVEQAVDELLGDFIALAFERHEAGENERRREAAAERARVEAARYKPEQDWNPVRRAKYKRELKAALERAAKERAEKGLVRPPHVSGFAGMFRRAAREREREWAARVAQCAYRRRLAKLELLRRRSKRRRRCVVLIQAAWRAIMARRHVQRIRAAVVIEKVARGHLGRKYAVQRRADLTWAARVVQRRYWHRIRNRAVQPIQRFFRRLMEFKADRVARVRRRRLREMHVAGSAQFVLSKNRELHRNVLDITYAGLDEDGDLQHLFRHFCSFGSRENTTRLESSKFVKILADGGLLNKDLNARQVELIFMRTKEHKERHLTYAQFLIALEEVARVRFPHVERYGTYYDIEAQMLELLLKHSFQSKTSKRFRRALKDNGVYKYTDNKIMWARDLIMRQWRLYSNWGVCPKLVFDALAAERQRVLEWRSAVLVQAAWRRNRAGKVMHSILRDNYKKFVDDATGYPFWVNSRTGATMWKKPLVFGTSDLEDTLFYPEESRKLVLNCSNDCQELSRHYCDECRDSYCSACIQDIHLKGKKAGHTWVDIDLCVECSFQVASKACPQCGDSYCDNCYPHRHRSGKMLEHDWQPLMPMCGVCGETAAHKQCDTCNGASYCRTCCDAEHALLHGRHRIHDQPFSSKNLDDMYAKREEERLRVEEEARLAYLARQADDRKVNWSAMVFQKHWRGRMGRRAAYARYLETKQFKLQEVIDNKVRRSRRYRLRKALHVAPPLETDPKSPPVEAPDIIPIVVGHLRTKAYKHVHKVTRHPAVVQLRRKLGKPPPEGEGEGEGGPDDDDDADGMSDDGEPDEKAAARGEVWLPGTVTLSKHHKIILTSEDLTEWVFAGDKLRIGNHRRIIPLNAEITPESVPVSVAWEDETVAGVPMFKLGMGDSKSAGFVAGTSRFLRRQRNALQRKARMFLYAQAVYATQNYNDDDIGKKVFNGIASALRRPSYAHDPYALTLPGVSRKLQGLTEVELAKKASKVAVERKQREDEEAAVKEAEAAELQAAEAAAAAAQQGYYGSTYDSAYDNSGGYYEEGYYEEGAGGNEYEEGAGGDPWERIFDEDSQLWYWYNHETGESADDG